MNFTFTIASVLILTPSSIASGVVTPRGAPRRRLAAAMPECDFVLVDVKPTCVRLGNERAVEAGIIISFVILPTKYTKQRLNDFHA